MKEKIQEYLYSVLKSGFKKLINQISVLLDRINFSGDLKL